MNSKARDRIRIEETLAPGIHRVVRDEDGRLKAGLLIEPRDGQPLPEGSDFVALGEDESEDGWHDCEVLYSMRSGPPQVATKAYCEGYDRIFGKKRVGLA